MVKSVPTVPLERFRKIARGLLEKTKVGQVNWVPDLRVVQVPETSYAVVLPQSRILLTYTVPRADSDYVTLELQNSDGTSVDSWSVVEPDYDPEHESIEEADPAGDWQLLQGLYSEVHRRVTGWDKVVNDVEKALSGNDPVGVHPGTSHSR